MLASSPKRTRQFLGALFSLPLLFCLVFFLFQLSAQRSELRLIKIQRLEGIANRLTALAKESESAERGYLLTGDTTMLTPFRQARLSMPGIRASIDLYSKDLPDLGQPTQELASAVEARLNETGSIEQTQRKSGFPAAIAEMEQRKGQKGVLVLRLAGALLDRLKNLEDQDMGTQQTLRDAAFIVFGMGTILMIAVMYWLYNEVLGYIDQAGQAQQQLEKFNLDLQRLVDDRTREVTEANRELQQFAYVASHDLQEPLRTITSFSQLFSSRYKGRLEEDADEFLGYIVTASKRMTELINGLLEIVRLRKASSPNIRVSFNKLLDDVEASLQASIRENKVTLERGPMPDLTVDRIQMLQVLQNLISNAIKYRRPEPPVIQIRAERYRNEWMFSVADNGQGFEQELSERIFGLFTRLHGRDVEGTGMGLSIARRIVERHGGRIWAESTEGKGSTFFFTLPVSLELPRATVAAAVAGETTRSGLTPRPGKVRAV